MRKRIKDKKEEYIGTGTVWICPVCGCKVDDGRVCSTCPECGATMRMSIEDVKRR